MDTKMLTEKINELETMRGQLKTLQQALADCSLSGHQKSITVNVGGVSVNLTENDRHSGYTSRLVRGREMIMLGVKKSILDRIHEKEKQIEVFRSKIAEEAMNYVSQL